MPSSLQKRKAARRKKKSKSDKRSSSSFAVHNCHGESDGDQNNSPNQMGNMENNQNTEDSSSGYESLTTTERTPKDAKEKQSKNKIEKQLILPKPAQIEIDKPPIIEPGTVADYLSQPFESSPEKGTPGVEDSGFKTPPVGGPLTPVGQPLVEMASKFDNDTKVQEKDGLVGAETSLEHTVVNETDSKKNEVLKENEVQKLDFENDNTSPKLKLDLVQDSIDGKCQYCGRSSNDRVDEPKIPECSERQPLLASTPRPPEKASWKNCCGIFELFSGSARN